VASAILSSWENANNPARRAASLRRVRRFGDDPPRRIEWDTSRGRYRWSMLNPWHFRTVLGGWITSLPSDWRGD
jgi:hypothetical protein